MPELGPVKIGDTLYVRETYRRSSEPVEVVVTKVGRVWIEMDPKEKTPSAWPTYRMRLDTQDGGRGGDYHSGYFMSPAQLAWRDREYAAGEYLKKIGVGITWDGQYRDRTVELANIIRAAEGLPEL